MFGMAASFTDTIVHFTPIHEIDNAWMDKKGRFLLARQEYSYQLRDYLAGQGFPQRTCIVIYDKKRKKAEKKRDKMIRLYNKPAKNGRSYDVRYIPQEDFRLRNVDMSESVEQERQTLLEQKEAEKMAKKNNKGKKKDKNAPKPPKPRKGGRP